MAYVKSSTENPFGHTPWQTALYTTFGDFAWLKQPQNAIVREGAGIAPRIRKPPELAGYGDVIVGGSGRVLGRLGSQMRLGLDMTSAEAARFGGLWRMAGGQPFQVAPIASAPARVMIAPIRVATIDSSTLPAVTPVTTAAGAVSSYTPGAPGTAGSPFTAADAAAAGSPPALTTAVAPAPSLLDQVKAWLAGSMFGGIPNYVLAIGAGGLLYAGTSSRKGGRF
jgi:hypothetical protein